MVNLRPDPLVMKRNRALVDLVLIQADLESDNDSPDSGATSQKYRRLAEELLALDNGPWGSATITHHCKGLLCCPHGLEETKRKIWCAVAVSRHFTGM